MPEHTPRAAHPLLDRRRVLVVGAGTAPSDEPDPPTGNGRAIAVTAAREGAHVTCADLDPGAAAATAAIITGAGGRAGAMAADAADPGACARLVADAAAAMGGLDGIAFNAGIGAGLGLAGTALEDWDRVLDVNLRGPFLIAKAALPLLEPGAALVFTGSLAGTKPGSRSPSYDASKAGLTGLVRHIAAEGAPRGVRANLVAPGLIDTVMGRAASAGNAGRDRITRLIPMGRQGTAWEVADAAVFLLSSRAAYITGQVLHVDGGLSTLR